MLDAMAARGVWFETALTAQPLTLPSHASILTGRYPFHHGVRNNGTYNVPESEVTLAERFQAAGYATHAVRLRLRPRQPVRPRPGLRRLRRRLRRRPEAADVHVQGDQGDADRRQGGRLARRRAAQGEALLPLAPFLRPARQLRAAARDRRALPGRPVPGRDPLRRPRARPGPPGARRGRGARPHSLRLHLRPWRQPGRARRAHSRAVRLRVDHARAAAARRAGRAEGRQGPGARPHRRHRADALRAGAARLRRRARRRKPAAALGGPAVEPERLPRDLHPARELRLVGAARAARRRAQGDRRAAPRGLRARRRRL